MTIDDLVKKIQSEDVLWDDVRERRVLNRIRDELERPATRVVRISPKAWATAGAVAALGLIGLAVVLGYSASKGPTLATAPSISMEESIGTVEPSVMVVGEVGQVYLMDGARVAILNQTPHVVRIRQTEGKAEYNINHQAGREVIVYVDEVQIRVIGTSFTVTMGKDLLNVQVSQGVVGINDGNRLLELRAGESIGVARRDPHGSPGSENKQAEDVKRPAEGDTLGEPLLGYDNGRGNDEKREDNLNNAPQEQRDAQIRSTADPYDKLSTKQLFAEVDRARKNGDPNKASRILESIIARDDSRSSTISALFTLGKVERANGRHVRAATAFFKCYKLATSGPLAEDALAEAAMAWSAAKDKEKATKAAQNYIDLYPNGIHAERMHLILK